jgi:hypothetical protein
MIGSRVLMPSPSPSSFVLLIMLVPAIAGAGLGADQVAPQVETCEAITSVRPGFGVPYRGTLTNGDYRLTVVIPQGLTGWGAGWEAPFHGFDIFFPDGSRSCMGFEIHLRVDLGEAQGAERRHLGTRAKIGNRAGWKEEINGIIDGSAWTNVKISFSVQNGTDVDDGSVWLVTPTGQLSKNMPIFNRFVSHIRFEAKLAKSLRGPVSSASHRSYFAFQR